MYIFYSLITFDSAFTVSLAKQILLLISFIFMWKKATVCLDECPRSMISERLAVRRILTAFADGHKSGVTNTSRKK